VVPAAVFVDALIVVLLISAAVMGRRRGAVLIGLELFSFAMATGSALVFYSRLAPIMQSWGLSLPLANVAAFSSLWVITEILVALALRLSVVRHLNRTVQQSWPNQAGGSALNGVKYLLLITVALIVVTGLPLSRDIKRLVTNSVIGQRLLASSVQVQTWFAAGLGQNLGDSLNFFSVTPTYENDKVIKLGFKTTGTLDDTDETAMLALVNQERTSRGLSALTLNPLARIAARSYSTRMFAEGYFSHLDPNGKNPFDRLHALGMTFGSAGENLALAPNLQLAHQGLMNSPGHRANILSPSFHTLGIGIIDGGSYGLMVTQEFTD
jgi:uncharacterized protein YkwD